MAKLSDYLKPEVKKTIKVITNRAWSPKPKKG